MSSLKQKTISGVIWSIIENGVNKGLLFVVGIILARILTPAEFGLIGMITIFIAISQSLVDAGFSQALIRKQNATKEDYSTVFIFNLVFSCFVYFVLFFLSTGISKFFKEPELVLLVKVLSINVVINSFGIVQQTKLIKRIDFKTQAKITIIAGLFSGILAIVLAYNGFGVWSLVAKTTIYNIVNVVMLYYFSGWTHKFIFDFKCFKSMFNFGYKIVAAGLLDTIYRNVYYIVIGKYFSAAQLGYYTRAEQFNNLPSSNLTTVIQRVSYPVLSELQDKPDSLKMGYKKVIASTMIVSFVFMLGMSATAKPLIFTLIGEKWKTSVLYLQLLCFVGMLYPLHGLNLNILKVMGRSDILLKLEVIKKVLAIPIIIVGIIFGIKWMLIGMIINSFIAYFLNSNWSGKLINYSTWEQLKDILPSFLVALSTSILVYLIGWILPLDNSIKLILQILFGTLITFIICELFNLKAYIALKEILIERKVFRKK